MSEATSALDRAVVERDLLDDLDRHGARFKVTDQGEIIVEGIDSDDLIRRVKEHRNEIRIIASIRQTARFLGELDERRASLEARIGPTKEEAKRQRSIAVSKRFDVPHRDGFKCTYCGAKGTRTSLRVDHIVPIAKGGKSTFENLTTACQECNAGKSDKSIEVDVPVSRPPSVPAFPSRPRPRREVGPPLSKEESLDAAETILAMLQGRAQ